MKLLLILIAAVLAANVYANIAPRGNLQAEAISKLPLPGHSLEPRRMKEDEQIKVEMVAEQVDLTLGRNGPHFYLDVDATFTMRNTGKAHTLGIAYPIGPRNNMLSFSAETEGVVHNHATHKRVEAIEFNNRKVNVEVWWYEWEFTFAAKQTSMHKVKYRMDVNPQVRTGYTVSTGGPWKGMIEKSVVTLAVAEGMDWGHVQAFGPLAHAGNANGRVVWNYADYEPGTEHDIFIELNTQTWKRRLLSAADTRRWQPRVDYCTLKRDAHYATGLVERSNDQNTAYAEALLRLIEEAKQVEDDVVLPRKMPYMRLKELPCGRTPEEIEGLQARVR
jgi:hypothetical protein